MDAARFEQIKHKYRNFNVGSDGKWLIAEVERLRAYVDSNPIHALNLAAIDDNVRLREALTAAEAEIERIGAIHCKTVDEVTTLTFDLAAAREALTALTAATKALAVQAAIVYDAYDNHEEGAAVWQEFVRLDALRAAAAGDTEAEK